jgi:uncharacterized protein (TIGR03083 family)
LRQTLPMERSRALSIIEREAARIVEVATDPNVARTAGVPTCPRWALDDLLDHLGRVYAMVATVIGDALGNPPDREKVPRRPEGEDPLDWMRERLGLLLPVLSEIPEGAARWNFVSGPRSPVGFWWRRQAHETLVHRVDAELAGRAPVREAAPEIAGDGVAEFLLVSGFSEAPGTDLDAGRGMTVHLHASDAPEVEWTIDTAGRTCARAHSKADVALRGPAWSLARWVWRRGSAAPGCGLPEELVLPDLEAFGDVRAAEAWRPAF